MRISDWSSDLCSSDLRTQLQNGDQVEILKSDGQEPSPGWLSFAITGKARAAIRRFVRHKQRDEMIELGEMLFEELASRLPVEIGDKALLGALPRMGLEDRHSQIGRASWGKEGASM